MRRSQIVYFMIFSLFLLGDFVSAQTYQMKPGRKQTLNFEDELVEGSAQKPELFYLFQKKNFNYTRLIKLRENFLPEMRRTSEDIQRLRGGR
ncbi:MAG: hypothetical protein ACK4VO_08860 [Pseudobdellovibrio sp.]